MDTEPCTGICSRGESEREMTWEDLMSWLRFYVRSFVYGARIPAWKGQEEDLIEDIVQETLYRVVRYAQQAQEGMVAPIASLKRISVVIARNYCVDRWRQDQRVQHTLSAEIVDEFSYIHNEQADVVEAVLEQVYQEELFRRVAQKVARFPARQRRALLIDLASRMHFDGQPTPLQRAFFLAGLDLRLYQGYSFESVQERARHAALVHIAYRRVRRCMQEEW